MDVLLDDDDVIGGIGIGVSDDEDDNPLIDDDDDDDVDNLGAMRATKRRASSAINPLVKRPLKR